jgi:hypothetical protein
VPLIDERTGAVSRQWYRWFYSLYTFAGEGSGILPVTSGGTGLSTIPTNGQLLIGNGTGYTLNTLGYGAGILVTNGLGTITVANTGALSNLAGTGISVSSATGNVTVANNGVLSIIAGTGISASSTTGNVTITNTLPDLTVALTGAGTTTVTGTYPNFTITSNDAFVGTVTSVSGTGSVNGITLSGAVTSSGNLTLGGALSGVSLTTQVSGILPVANGGTGAGAAYTVATLPTAGTQGRRAWVTDALAPAFGAAPVGGGAVVIPVFDNGTIWVVG